MDMKKRQKKSMRALHRVFTYGMKICHHRDEEDDGLGGGASVDGNKLRSVRKEKDFEKQIDIE